MINIIYIYNTNNNKKDLLMAQTKHLASFGPVFLVVVSCKSVCIAEIPIVVVDMI